MGLTGTQSNTSEISSGTIKTTSPSEALASRGAFHTLSESRQASLVQASLKNTSSAGGMDLDSIAADIGSMNASTPNSGVAPGVTRGLEAVARHTANKAGKALETTSSTVTAGGAVVTTGAAIEVAVVTAAETAAAAATAAEAAAAAAAALAATGGTTAAAVGGGAVATVASTGAAASTGLGPFFWVGLIVTAVAAGITAIAMAIKGKNRRMASNEKKVTNQRIQRFQKSHANKPQNILKDSLMAKSQETNMKATPSSSGMATMDISHTV